MTSKTQSIFSSSELERLQNLLKHPQEDVQEIIELLKKKVEVENKKCIESENKLKKTEQRFKSLIEQTTDAVFCYEYNPSIPINLPIEDQVTRLYDGILVDCNLVCARSYGVEHVEDVIGHKLTDLFGTAPHSLDKLFKELIEGGYNIVDGVGIEKLPNGEERYFLNNGHSVIENNKLVRIWGTFRDITNRKKAEKILKESEERYRSLINNITDIIYELDINGKCIYASNQLFEISGFHPEEMIGQNVFKYLHPDDLFNVAEKVKEAFNSGIRISADFGLKHKEGFYVPVSSNFNMIDTNGYSRLIGVLRDNTEQKKAEDAFLEERKFTEIALNAQRDTFFIFEPSTGIAIRWNQAFREISGYSDEEISKMRAPDSYYNEDDLKLAASAIEIIRTEGEALIEMNLITKKGNEIPFEYLGSSINDDGGDLKYIVATGRDITERKKKDNELRESEEKFRMLTDQSLMGIAIFQDDKYVYINQRFADIIDYTVEEMLQWNLEEINRTIHPDDLKFIREQSIKKQKGIDEGIVTNYSYRKITKSKTIKWVDHYSKTIVYKGNFAILLTQIDITERKEINEALRESEKFLKKAQMIAHTGHWKLNPQTLEVSGSDELFDIFELSQEEATLDAFIDVVHPDDREYDLHHIRRGMEYGESWDIEHRLITKKGTEKWVHALGEAVKNEKGEIIMLLGTIQDITDKKESEEKLKKSEEKFRVLFENFTSGVAFHRIVYDSTGNPLDYIIIDVNPQYESVLSLEKKKVINKRSTEVYQIESPPYFDIFLNVVETGESTSFETYFSPMNKHFKVSVISPSDGEFITTFDDISDRKRVELALKESEEKYRLLFDNSPVGIGLSTIEGEVFDNNEAMAKLTGYNAKDLNDAGVNAIYADSDVRSKILKVLQEEGKLHDYEVKLRRKDNTEFFGSISFDLIELGGRKIIQTSLTDITKSKNAELELIKLNNLKSELLRRTSHELKTPLVSIKGFSDLLLQVHRDKLDSLVISILNEIRQGCVRLETLIADILKTSELESGTIKLHPSKEDLSFLIRLCVNELKGLSILRNLTINLEIPESLITYFEKEQIHQVVSNLLNNSVKYTPPGGFIEIKSEIKNEFIITSIKDSGIGFSDEEKIRIFKQFGKIERYGQGLDIISEGSGLGLYISKKIIELHGGEIWVESEGKNKGSTFLFSLPLNEKE
jgi:PAS domain S-box-containing protein